MVKVFLFPGQGSQNVGMGKDLYENFTSAKQVFDEVDDALNQKLSDIIFNGSSEDLTLTSNTQPALMAVSLATLKVIEQESGKKINDLCDYVAGHSLGEYSALCAANAISLSDTAKLLRIRGNSMQDAVPNGIGAMAALIGVDFQQAQDIANQATCDNFMCQIANDNGGGQIVLSGHVQAIDKAIEIAGQLKVKRAVKLPVSAPFHSKLMQPAATIMQEALSEVKITSPQVNLVANVTASQVKEPVDIRELLTKQVTAMVRWRESIIYLKKSSVTNAFEIGAGKVLSGLVKRIDKEISSISVQSAKDIESFLKLI